MSFPFVKYYSLLIMRIVYVLKSLCSIAISKMYWKFEHNIRDNWNWFSIIFHKKIVSTINYIVKRKENMIIRSYNEKE